MYVDPVDREYLGHEHIVVTMNHTYEIDWLMAWIIAERYKVIGVSIDWLMAWIIAERYNVIGVSIDWLMA
jgi:hypothetical protein